MLRILLMPLAVASMVSCLPADTRPVPAHLHVAVVRDPQLGEGPATFTSADGWSVTVQTLTAAMGNVRFDGKSCNAYSEAGYTHLLDLNRSGTQKLAEVYGLNACMLRFSLRLPQTNTVLGQGLTNSDRAFMQYANVPVSSTTGPTTVQGMALHIAGHIDKAGVTVDFDWGFERPIRYTECQRRVSGKFEPTMALASGEYVEVPITVDPRNLFGIGLDPKLALLGASTTDAAVPPSDASTPLTDASTQDLDASVGVAVGISGLAPMSLVQWIVDADRVLGDKNGHVSVDELTKVTLPGAQPGENLAEILRLYAYPTLFRYDDDGQCTVPADSTPRGGGGFF
jgi:hypothetical protein